MSANKNELIANLKKLNLSPININVILLTHNHWDYVENLNLFSNAKIYSGKKDFPEKEILDLDKLKITEFKIIKSPGHTKGRVCFLYENILFSGDTIFHNGIGRTDLPGSSETEIKNSLDENLLALTCICEGRNFMDLSNYQKLIRPLSNKIKMLVLLKKSWRNKKLIKNFDEIVEKENPI